MNNLKIEIEIEEDKTINLSVYSNFDHEYHCTQLNAQEAISLGAVLMEYGKILTEKSL